MSVEYLLDFRRYSNCKTCLLFWRLQICAALMFYGCRGMAMVWDNGWVVCEIDCVSDLYGILLIGLSEETSLLKKITKGTKRYTQEQVKGPGQKYRGFGWSVESSLKREGR